jgi:DNA-binding protein
VGPLVGSAWGVVTSCSRRLVTDDDLLSTWEQRFLQEHGEVQLSALGVAISSMVTLAEILKNKQLAVETRVVTSLEEISSESR